jgi:hypothetical protein
MPVRGLRFLLVVLVPLALAATASAADAPTVAIRHRDVGCVVAGQFPRLEACFTPAENVGRAQVEFRADEKGPWYAVTMTPSGACHTALLPKPMKGTASFRYFIGVVEKGFAIVHQPANAPGGSYGPVVVDRAAACGSKALVATSQPTGSVVVSVARDAGGKVLQAAAQTAGQPASIAGFSGEGVTFANPPATPGAPPAGAAAAAGGGIGLTTLAIAGGAVAAGGLVAVAASGGGDEDTPETPREATVSGRWTGTAANGTGLSLVETLGGITCTGRWDLTADLTQTGTTVGGNVSSVSRSFTCSIPIDDIVQPVFIGQTGGAPVTGTASAGAMTLRAGDLTFTGTYSASRIELRATQQVEGITLNYTMILTK